MREFINKFGVPVAAVAIVIAIVVIVWYSRGSSAPTVGGIKYYYFDEEAGTESVHRDSEVPPLKGAGGNPSVVRVIKFSCDGGKTSKAAYFLKYTPEAKAELEKVYASKGTYQPNINVLPNTLIRAPEPGSPWVLQSSDAGAAIIQRMSCQNGMVMTILPP